MKNPLRQIWELVQEKQKTLRPDQLLKPSQPADTVPRPKATGPETLPLSPQEGVPIAAEAQIPSRPPQVTVGVGLSTGIQREHNEDALFAQTLTLAAGERDLLVGLYIIADGMGGHQHGELASAVAARTFAHYLYEHLILPLAGPQAQPPEEPVIEIMAHATQAANQQVVETVPGGGTTLTAVLLLGQHLTIAHVGDSRAYFIHPDGRLQTLTRDHSLVKRLEELGQLTPEEAAVHPQRNVLYRALGQLEPLEPEVTQMSLPNAGHLLLCSDGLWGVVPEEDLLQTVLQAENPTQACAQLIQQANQRGGPDNISVVIVRIGDG